MGSLRTIIILLILAIVFFGLEGKNKLKGTKSRSRRQSPAYFCLREANSTHYVDSLPSYGDVMCDVTTEGGGWIIIMRRYSGRLSFDRSWDEYDNGFGNIYSEFWMGMNKIFSLTSSAHFYLRVDIIYGGIGYWAKYSSFKIYHSKMDFKLRVCTYVGGTAGDSFSYHNNSVFSTADRDNTISTLTNCYSLVGAPWWYKYCDKALLFGRWRDSTYGSMVHWSTLTDYTNNVDSVQMMMKVDQKWY